MFFEYVLPELEKRKKQKTENNAKKILSSWTRPNGYYIMSPTCILNVTGQARSRDGKIIIFSGLPLSAGYEDIF